MRYRFLSASPRGDATNVLVLNRRGFMAAMGAVAGTAMVSGPMPARAAGKKVAAIFFGQAKVGNFEITGSTAFEAMVKKYGFESEFAEQVPFEGGKEVMTDFANREFDLVVAHSSGYQSAVLDVAPNFPKTWFVLMVDGDSTGGNPNVAVYAFSTYEVLYLSGAVAGLMTKSTKLGIVGAIPLPGIRSEMAGFIDGAKAANPAVEVESIWINSFTDAAKGKEAALAMIGRGADIIGHVSDAAGEGVFQAAREKGAKAIGAFADEGITNPDVVLTSGSFNEMLSWDLLGKGLSEGTLEPKVNFGGIKEGWISQGGYHNVPEDVQAKIEAMRADILSGKLVLTPRMVPEP